MDHDKDGQGADLARMAGWMGGALEAAAAGQALTLALLRAEMEAIAQLMPGVPADPIPDAEEEATRRADEARIEEDHDNLPV
ncbi:hypothetical protein [Fuscovulum ytuae]|uniref:Uncharacterized protein n=1 Tax=Fuscovulum ytuae TaxID=3042299 RepID=A0ABY8Q842_9RHOB|nr:hypothetical protein [Fuscovulum sp. YMD61]WGV16822.1 hypothetical protein QF092_03130 [Fuscovulum sp. YMD61]